MATATLINDKTGKTKRIKLAGALGLTTATELNIAYGDTAPDDTTKLWVKTAAPSNVMVTSDIAGEESDVAECDATLPGTTGLIGTAAVGKKIYLFGGNSSGSAIRVFDTGTNTITTLSTKLPTAATGIGTAAVGGKIYLFGGNSSSGGGYLNTIQVFDTETNTITTLSTKLPTTAYTIGTAAVGKKIYLFGGKGSSSLNTIQVFDTETNTITTLSTKLPTAASGIGTAAVGGKIYLFGGNSSAIRVFYERFPLPNGQLILKPTTGRNVFTLIRTSFNTVKLGVVAAYIGNADGYAELVPAALYVDGAWVDIV